MKTSVTCERKPIASAVILTSLSVVLMQTACCFLHYCKYMQPKGFVLQNLTLMEAQCATRSHNHTQSKCDKRRGRELGVNISKKEPLNKQVFTKMFVSNRWYWFQYSVSTKTTITIWHMQYSLAMDDIHPVLLDAVLWACWNCPQAFLYSLISIHASKCPIITVTMSQRLLIKAGGNSAVIFTMFQGPRSLQLDHIIAFYSNQSEFNYWEYGSTPLSVNPEWANLNHGLVILRRD